MYIQSLCYARETYSAECQLHLRETESKALVVVQG